MGKLKTCIELERNYTYLDTTDWEKELFLKFQNVGTDETDGLSGGPTGTLSKGYF